jgi:uncharacterized membrane protein
MDTPESIAAEYIRQGGKVEIGKSVERGWALVRDNFGVVVGATLLGWIVSIGLGFLPLIGWAIGIVLLGGLDMMFIRRIRGEQVQVGDVFAGFNLAFFPLVMGGLLKWLFVSVGLLLCILPGIYLVVGYLFALPLIIDKKLDFWPALEVSRRVVHEQWLSAFGLAIVLVLIVCAGVLACGVGVVVAIPVVNAALMFTYEDLFNRAK